MFWSKLGLCDFPEIEIDIMEILYNIIITSDLRFFDAGGINMDNKRRYTLILISLLFGSLPLNNSQANIDEMEKKTSHNPVSTYESWQILEDEDTGFITKNPVIVYYDETNAMQGINYPAQGGLNRAERTATFQIQYIEDGGEDLWEVPCNEFPAEARTALDYAADIWEATIHSTVPITIRACWADLGDERLGYSGGGFFVNNFSGAPDAETLFLSSLANALHGSDLMPGYFDMHITFSQSYEYYFGTDANPGLEQLDFVTLALHEIGHGLNFSSEADWVFGNGYIGWGYDRYSNYDKHMVTRDGLPLTDYEYGSSELGGLLIGNVIYFSGDNADAANGGQHVRIYAPNRWDSGSSYVHLDYYTYNETVNSLMVFAQSKGSANHDTGPVTRGILADLGWPDRLEPYPPEIVWASDDTFDDRVRISWDWPGSATHFEVYRHSSDTTVGATHLTPDPTSSSFDDFFATPGDTYYYWIKACNTAGCSEFSIPDTGSAAILSVPPAPINVAASDGSYTDRVLITWDAPADATFYKVYRDIDPNISGAFLVGNPVLGTTYWDTSAAGLLYYYWVSACNASGCSSYSIPNSGYIEQTGPVPPTGVTASDGEFKEKIVVSWEEQEEKNTYQVYRNIENDSSGAELVIDSLNALTYEDTSVLPATVYYYWIKACNSTTCSWYSTPDSGHVTFTPPEKPIGVTASDGLYIDKIRVSWNERENADYYQVYRNVINNTSSALLITDEHAYNHYMDIVVITGTKYYYYIKACNSEGCSGYSSVETGFAGHQTFLPIVIR
jgi:fibronectin type 3 domain-containing protein